MNNNLQILYRYRKLEKLLIFWLVVNSLWMDLLVSWLNYVRVKEKYWNICKS